MEQHRLAESTSPESGGQSSKSRPKSFSNEERRPGSHHTPVGQSNPDRSYPHVDKIQTDKQRKLVKLLSENFGLAKPKTMLEMMLEAGYEESSARQERPVSDAVHGRAGGTLARAESVASLQAHRRSGQQGRRRRPPRGAARRPWRRVAARLRGTTQRGSWDRGVTVQDGGVTTTPSEMLSPTPGANPNQPATASRTAERSSATGPAGERYRH
jgi:hypothetical protein